MSRLIIVGINQQRLKLVSEKATIKITIFKVLPLVMKELLQSKKIKSLSLIVSFENLINHK